MEGNTMDFSFLENKPSRNTHASTAGQTTGRSGVSTAGPSRIQIPSFTEIQAAQQPSHGALNSFFKPKGLLSGAQQQQQQQQTGYQQPVASGSIAQTQSWGSAAIMPGPSPGVHGGVAQLQQHQQHAQPPSAAWHAGAAIHSAHQPSFPNQQGIVTGQPASGSTATPMMGGTAVFSQQGFPQQAVAVPAATGNTIVVSKRQTGNPILKHIRNVRWVFGDIGPDYLLGANACALFLSLRYHLLHPNYILYRIKELGRAYGLRIVLVQVDVDDVVKPLADITKAAALNDCTLICAWSAEEAGRYLETYKAFENKPATGIQERVDADYASRLASALTAVRAVNRTDALALGAQFGTLSDVMTADKAALSAVPGVGPIKVQNLWDTFNKPFRKQATAGAVTVQAATPVTVPTTRILNGSVIEAHGDGSMDAGDGRKVEEGEGRDRGVVQQQQQQQQGAVHREGLAASSMLAKDQQPQYDMDMDRSRGGAPEGEGDYDEAGEGEGEEEEDGQQDELLLQASQMIFHMQAGAMAVGAVVSEDEQSAGEEDDKDWVQGEEVI